VAGGFAFGSKAEDLGTPAAASICRAHATTQQVSKRQREETRTIYQLNVIVCISNLILSLTKIVVTKT
jgi:hypothetical protein